jgi:hypothetical protein
MRKSVNYPCYIISNHRVSLLVCAPFGKIIMQGTEPGAAIPYGCQEGQLTPLFLDYGGQ